MINYKKYAIIRKTNKSAEGLEHKSLSEEISKLINEGYKVINEYEYLEYGYESIDE